MRILVGRMRVPPAVFWGLTFPEANLMVEEWIEEGRERKREGAARVFGVISAQSTEPMSASDLWKSMTGEDLPGDKINWDDDLRADMEVSRERARKAKEARENK